MSKNSKAVNDMKGFFKKLQKFTGEAVKPLQMRLIAKEAITLVVRRTKLGYGVKTQFGDRSRLNELSPKYKRTRKLARARGKLDNTTAPNKSNLTFTGQMLRSLDVVRVENGKITIEPTGTRRDGKRNYDVAEWCAARGRVFNRLSRAEGSQLLRGYRKRFGDLLGKLRLLE